MPVLEVVGLGTLTLSTTNSIVFRFPTRHVEELLGFLLLNQRTPFSRETLVDLLWPNDIVSDCRGCLSNTLWRLGCLFRQLGLAKDDFLCVSREYVQFDPKTPIVFDVPRFSSALKEAAAATDDLAKSVGLEAALGIYGGELFTGLYADWCLVERERLSRMHQQALADLMYAHIRLERFETAIEVGQAILREDPLREDIHRALMRCYGFLQDRRSVQRQFRHCSEVLYEELQVLPMPETVKAYQQSMVSLVCNQAKSLPDARAHSALRALRDFQDAGDRLDKQLLSLLQIARSDN